MATPKNTFHVLMWISHGSNVSSNSQYVEYENYKFKSLSMHGRIFNAMWKTDLVALEEGMCRIITYATPFPLMPKGNNKNSVYVPPLLYCVLNPDIEPNKTMIGLYHVHLEKVGYDTVNSVDICSTISNTKLMDYETIKNKYGFLSQNNDNYITYSQIFKLCEDYCKQANLDVKDVNIALFACQNKARRYLSRYNQQDPNLLLTTRRSKIPLTAKIYDTLNHLNKAFDFGLTMIPIHSLKQQEQISPIAKIRHQGCGLNVLNYFDLIDRNTATEDITCLNLTGTSIFELLEYMDRTLSKIQTNRGYIIVRMGIVQGIQYILEYLKRHHDNYGLIIKMYETMYQPNNDKKFNHVGHTVAFAKLHGQCHYIDPQIKEKYKILSNPGPFAAWLMKKYSKNFMDVIFTVRVKGGFGTGTYYDFSAFEQSITNVGGIVVSPKGIGSFKLTREKMATPSPKIKRSNQRTRYAPNITGMKRSRSKSKSKDTSSPTRKRKRPNEEDLVAMKVDSSISLGGTKSRSKTRKIHATGEVNMDISLKDYLKLNQKIDKKFHVQTHLKPIKE